MEMGIRKPVKFLIVKNLHYEIGFTNITQLKLLQEKSGNPFLTVGICSKTMVRENPKPFRDGHILVHGLICCKNGCGYWNRDTNGATNIYRIASNAIHNKA